MRGTPGRMTSCPWGPDVATLPWQRTSFQLASTGTALRGESLGRRRTVGVMERASAEEPRAVSAGFAPTWLGGDGAN